MAGTGESLDKLLGVVAHRSHVIEEVSNSPKTKPELVTRLPDSRSTIDRAIDQLLSEGLVREENREFEVTPVGRAMLELHREYVETATGLVAARPVLNALAPTDPVHHVMLSGAEVYVSNPQTPEIGIQRSIEVVENASQFTGYSSVVFEECFDVQLRLLQRETFETEIVLERNLFDQIQTHFQDKFNALVDHDRASFWITDKMITYAPWLAIQESNTYAGMTVYDDGAMQGVIVNDSPQAVNWMTDLLSSITDEATPYPQ